MIPATTLALGGTLHKQVRNHLFPGDGLEAAGILLCARTPAPRDRLIARHFIPIPYQACSLRQPDAVCWPGLYLERAIEEGEEDDLVIILVHAHPGGLFAFSDLDDDSDRITMPALLQAYGNRHGTAIMTPSGAMRARLYDANASVSPVDLVTVSGDDIHFWWHDQTGLAGPNPRPVAFTGGMTTELGRLHAIILGVSGTGSIEAEQAARLGFGRVTLIDFDRVEPKNLNRILNSTTADADAGRLKVEMFADAITQYRGADIAVPIGMSIDTREAVLAASQGDVLFSCVDNLAARYYADLIAAAFLLPLFDTGVVIPVRRVGNGVAIADAVGRIDYVQPGGATLGDRGVYTAETLRAEYLQNVAPDSHAQEVEAGYLKGIAEEAPAVISLNMRAASACMNEFILRTYPFRLDPNRNYARTRFSLAGGDEDNFSEDDFKTRPNRILGRGAVEPLLGLPALGLRAGTK